LNFKVGKTLNSKTLIGFDLTAVSQTGSLGGIDGHIQINNYFFMFTHFPKEEGFFIRAGGGLSNLMFEIDGAFSASDSTGGFGILGGIGYAFWLGKRFNLTLNIDHYRQFYEGGNDPDNSQFTSFYVGFDWY
jgi:hypothetical protein